MEGIHLPFLSPVAVAVDFVTLVSAHFVFVSALHANFVSPEVLEFEILPAKPRIAVALDFVVRISAEVLVAVFLHGDPRASFVALIGQIEDSFLV